MNIRQAIRRINRANRKHWGHGPDRPTQVPKEVVDNVATRLYASFGVVEVEEPTHDEAMVEAKKMEMLEALAEWNSKKEEA